MILGAIPLLFPRDLEKAIEFYTETLGFTVSQQENDFAELRQGETALWLHKDEGLRDKEFEQELQEQPRGIGITLFFEVTDIKDTYNKLQEKGAEVVQEIHETPWGANKVTVVDPDGYHLSLFSYE